jgi:hypothetical protein
MRCPKVIVTSKWLLKEREEKAEHFSLVRLTPLARTADRTLRRTPYTFT